MRELRKMYISIICGQIGMMAREYWHKSPVMICEMKAPQIRNADSKVDPLELRHVSKKPMYDLRELCMGFLKQNYRLRMQRILQLDKWTGLVIRVLFWQR